jgi:hypothetical protein
MVSRSQPLPRNLLLNCSFCTNEGGRIAEKVYPKSQALTAESNLLSPAWMSHSQCESEASVIC